MLVLFALLPGIMPRLPAPFLIQVWMRTTPPTSSSMMTDRVVELKGGSIAITILRMDNHPIRTKNNYTSTKKKHNSSTPRDSFQQQQQQQQQQQLRCQLE